jgi:hypothetical protein
MLYRNNELERFLWFRKETIAGPCTYVNENSFPIKEKNSLLADGF